MKLKVRMVVTVVLAALLVLVASALPASAEEGNTAPVGFCGGGTSWVVRSQATLADPACPAGNYVLTSDEWGKQSFASFADAETFRAGRDTTYWFEPAVAVTGTAVVVTSPVAAQATVVASSVYLNWDNFCKGISPLVFTGGGILNAGDLSQLSLPCGKGTIVLVEPWRVGCDGNVAVNPNCNVGLRQPFSSWEEMTEWLVAGRWTEGSVWFRPEGWDPLDTVVSTSAQTAEDEVSMLRQMIQLLERLLALHGG